MASFDPADESLLPARPIVLQRLPSFGALATLFQLTLRQHVRGRRLIVLGCLFLIPTVIAVLVRALSSGADQQGVRDGLIFTMIPHALLPLAALLYAAGLIRDEVEDQTLTYLLIRPLPRWAIYLTKLIATWLMTALLAGVFTTLAFLAIYWGRADLWTDVLPHTALRTVLTMALALAAYCALFGLLGMIVQRTLVLGVAYIIIFEYMLANIDFVVRRLTVVFYFRVLCARWVDVQSKDWSLNLELAPGVLQSALTLLIVTVVAAALGAWACTNREFRVKTPEGS